MDISKPSLIPSYAFQGTPVPLRLSSLPGPFSTTTYSYVLVIDNDVRLFAETQSIAHIRDMHLKRASTLDEARLLLSHCQPDAILFSLASAGSEDDGLCFLKELSRLAVSVPVIVFSSETSFKQRLCASRLGAQGFLRKPIVPSDILDMLMTMVNRKHVKEAKVVLFSEDRSLLGYLKRLLMCKGLCPTLINDLTIFWSMLEHLNPDLAILDIDDTSSITGIELCHIVRQDPSWANLPIILLSERADRGMLQQVFAAGADDYVQKPVFEPEFITRILNRLERSRLLHEMADTDGLTHLSNRRKATVDINRLISLAERQDKSLCFVILDMDQFKHINDTYGHAAGDQTLYNTGNALKQTFRQADVISRWGGDEFVLGLFDSTAEQCARRLMPLLQQLKLHTIHCASSPDIDIQVTYSTGIAEYPRDGYTLEALYQSADQALYYAKENGRNQICLAQSLL